QGDRGRILPRHRLHRVDLVQRLGVPALGEPRVRAGCLLLAVAPTRRGPLPVAGLAPATFCRGASLAAAAGPASQGRAAIALANRASRLLAEASSRPLLRALGNGLAPCLAPEPYLARLGSLVLR